MGWKLSVAEKIPQFFTGVNWESTLDGDVTSGAAVTTDDYEQKSYILVGDIVKIGPSSHSNNPGKFEYKRVYSIANYVITFDSDLTYDYADEDHISAVGHSVGNNWYWSNSGYEAEIYYYGINSMDSDNNYQIREGFLANNNALWVAQTGTASGGTVWNSLIYNFNKPVLSGVTYRVGCYNLVEGFSGISSYIRLSFASSSSTHAYVDLGASASSWTKMEGTGVGSSSDFSNSFVALSFRKDCTFTLAGYDCIYITHAHNTSGQSNGYYEFSIDPSDIKEMFDDNISNSSGLNYNDFYVSNLNYRRNRGYSLRFDKANSTILKQLHILQYWQDCGNLLMLESDISGDRPIFGYMKFNWSYLSWDTSVISLDLIFEGVS